MKANPKEIDVAWVPSAQPLLQGKESKDLANAFWRAKEEINGAKEEAVQLASEQKLENLSQANKASITCTMGCASCCHARVDISLHEKRLLKASVLAFAPQMDRKRLETQTKALSLGEWDRLSFQERSCLFLDKQNLCQIYDKRPLLCRRYLVSSDPELCHQERFQEVEKLLDAELDGYLSAVFTRFHFMALPLFISQVLEEEENKRKKAEVREQRKRERMDARKTVKK